MVEEGHLRKEVMKLDTKAKNFESVRQDLQELPTEFTSVGDQISNFVLPADSTTWRKDVFCVARWKKVINMVVLKELEHRLRQRLNALD